MLNCRVTRRDGVARALALASGATGLLAATAGCGGAAPAAQPPSRPAAGGKPVTLAFASNASASAEEPVLNAVIAEFMNRYPNVRVEATYAPAD